MNSPPSDAIDRILEELASNKLPSTSLASDPASKSVSSSVGRADSGDTRTDLVRSGNDRTVQNAAETVTSARSLAASEAPDNLVAVSGDVNGGSGKRKIKSSSEFASTMASLMSSGYQSASDSINASPSCTPTTQWTGTLGKKPAPPNSSSRAKGIADLEREMEELRTSYQQVCEERDALEDLLLQEQLKNRTPADKQLEEAKAHAAALELELRSMAARCEEWKRRAAQRAAEMNPAMVQALLEERLEDLDESGTIKIQMEVARLRDELAKSEVLRFELFRNAQDGPATSSKWEAEEEGLKQQMEEVDAGREVNSKSIDEIPESTVWRDANSMEEAEDLMQELLEMGQASLSQQDVERLSEAVEAAEHRAVEAERRAAQAEKEAAEKALQIRMLEAKLTALLGDPSSIEANSFHGHMSSASLGIRPCPVPSASSTGDSGSLAATTATHTPPAATAASVHGVSRRKDEGAWESVGRRDSVVVVGSQDGASAVGKEMGGSRGSGTEVESSGGESGGESLKELTAAQVADVEEIRQIVNRVQGQNRFTHLLLTVVFAASVPRVVDMVKNLLSSKQRPRYTRITHRAARSETFGER
ncbi:hypothetical protein CLOM_g8730 [Closterium sp. NIES-68]|nr:hypothetical protein CLOM_g8730 [Closterium sp. NIES-68]GJP68600.1 hypothetical protein CLOP_g25280 [Closterium sp. NIES-67]